MLHVLKAAECLPIGVFNPHFEQCLITEIESRFEIEQTNDDSRVQTRAADFLRKTEINFLIDLILAARMSSGWSGLSN
jgi:hypothetical protein